MNNLETKRCNIKKTDRADFEDLMKLFTDSKVWDYLGGQRNTKQIEARMAEWTTPQQNCQYWTVREKESGTFLGCILFTPHHEGEWIQLSYMFLSRYWGKALLSKQLTKYCINLSRIMSIIRSLRKPNPRTNFHVAY